MIRTHSHLIAPFTAAMISLQSASAEDFTRVEITSREETYAYASDLLSSVVLNPLVAAPALPFIQLAASSIDAALHGCGNVDIWGVQFSGEDAGVSFDFQSAIPRAIGLAGDFGMNGINKNGVFFTFVPEITPCGPTSVQTRAGGTTEVYVSHIGTGPYIRKTNEGHFHLRRTVVIDNRSAGPVELPVHISGSAVAALSLAPDVRTFSRASLRIHGDIGGIPLDESILAVGEGVIPEPKSINVTRRVQVCPPGTRREFSYELRGEFSVDVMAKGIGFFGLLTQSATASVDFQDTIAILPFTGPQGAPLPPDVTIRVAGGNGEIIADTTPALEFLGIDPDGGPDARFLVKGPVGRAMQLEFSKNLRDWDDFGNPLVPATSAQILTIPMPDPPPAGFFRIKSNFSDTP